MLSTQEQRMRILCNVSSPSDAFSVEDFTIVKTKKEKPKTKALSFLPEDKLKIIYDEVGDSNSWDSPQYVQKFKPIQEKILLNDASNNDLTYLGLVTLADRYLLRDSNGKLVETPQKFFARVAAGISNGDLYLAQSLYDAISKLYFIPATPILANAASNRGLMISCFSSCVVEDSIEGIFSAIQESAMMGKLGSGIGTYWGNVRGAGAKISNGGKSSGVIPFLKTFDSSILAVSQGNVRRGAGSAYIPVSHIEIEQILDLKNIEGDKKTRCYDTFFGICIDDEFMKAVQTGDKYLLKDSHDDTLTKEVDARSLFKKILLTRAKSGQPYLFFTDTVNKLSEGNEYIYGSNLCSEICLPANNEETPICCLGSLNLEKWDEYKEDIDHITKIAVKALDNVLDHFVEEGSKIRGLEKAVKSTIKHRPIGLGVMGLHSYYQKHKMPVESIMARATNRIIFLTIKESVYKTTTRPYSMAVAPTANISVIAGGCSPSIEPWAGNAFNHGTSSGKFLVTNKYLREELKSLDMDSDETWNSIISNHGSVQHLDIPQELKDIFKTAYELDQKELVIQNAERSPYVNQGISFNIFYPQGTSISTMADHIITGWSKSIKTFYYVRSEAVNKIVEKKECTVCQ